MITTSPSTIRETGCAGIEVSWDTATADRARQLVIDATGSDCFHEPDEPCFLVNGLLGRLGSRMVERENGKRLATIIAALETSARPDDGEVDHGGTVEPCDVDRCFIPERAIPSHKLFEELTGQTCGGDGECGLSDFIVPGGKL